MSAVRGLRRPSWLTVYTWLALAFLFLPVAFVVLFSFDASGLGTFPIERFSTTWYSSLAHDDQLVDAAVASAIVAVATAIITAVLGVLAAFALTRYRVRLAPLFTGMIVGPIVLPALIVGVALLATFSKLGLPRSLVTVTLGHVLITLPFVVLTMNARLTNLDPSLEEAAGTLGATALQRLRHVTLPLIRPSLVGVALLVAAISLDEFVVTFFVVGSDNTLPIVIWGRMRAGVSPDVNAVSTLMLVTTFLVVLAVRKLTNVRFR